MTSPRPAPISSCSDLLMPAFAVFGACVLSIICACVAIPATNTATLVKPRTLPHTCIVVSFTTNVGCPFKTPVQQGKSLINHRAHALCRTYTPASMKKRTACPFGATFTAPSVVPLHLGISETAGKRRQAVRRFPRGWPFIALGVTNLLFKAWSKTPKKVCALLYFWRVSPSANCRALRVSG